MLPTQSAMADEQRAELEVLRDLKERLIFFDGGPEVMSWEDAHRHHRDEPYIGCVFCRDKFVRTPTVGFIGDHHSGGIVVNGHDVGLNGIRTPEAVGIVQKIKAALESPCI